MGVKGLQTYVQSRLPLSDFTVHLASLRDGTADMVVVDGMALIRRLYEQTLDWAGCLGFTSSGQTRIEASRMGSLWSGQSAGVMGFAL